MSTSDSASLPVLMQRLWRHLSRRRRNQFGLLVILMLATALAEVISLGAVLPFIEVLTAPERVYSHPLAADIASSLGVTSAEHLLLPFTLIFAMSALIAGAVRLLQMWANTRFAHIIGHDLSMAAYLRTLYQPYETHLERNSSEVIGGVNKVDNLVAAMLQILSLLSALALAVFVVLTLIVINPIVSSFAFLGFGMIYGLVTWLTRQRLQYNGQVVAREYTRRLKALQEGLGGIRDVLLGGYQNAYGDIFRNADLPMRRAQGSTSFIGSSPRYAVEALSMVLIALLAYGLSRQPGEMATVIPVLGALALGAQRLLPALQAIYGSWASIAGSQASLMDALDLLGQSLPENAFLPPPPPLNFNREVRFESVQFGYSHGGPLVLDGLDLTIPHGARVGFVGSTGSGKSTTLDLFMGLLKPLSGRILADGLPLHGERLRAWHRIIAHVPQSIFLADTSLAENIAFGELPEAIDMDRVKQAAKQAHIAEFIESNPKGYRALVGERGIRLSGGQRQRIGIARALYKQATVLVFDEATSALDNKTEQAVMDAIDELGRDLTILIIAHRLTTVMRCDLIVELDQGRVAAQGTYEQLVEHSPGFRGMAQLAGNNP